MLENGHIGQNAGVQPPTARLPSIKQLENLFLDNKPGVIELLLGHVDYLRSIYNPPVRGYHRRGRQLVFSVEQNQSHLPNMATSSPASDDLSEQAQLEVLRSDVFEQSYALRWLSALMRVTQKDDVMAGFDETDDTARRAFFSLIDSVAALLASCSGTSGAGIITRNFVFYSGAGSVPRSFPERVSVSLTDRPLDNSDFRSVGAQTWGGACVLAEEMIQKPMIFFKGALLRNEDHKDTSEPFRILELGAGTGLVSLVAARLWEGMTHDSTAKDVNIVATDYYPPVLQNLEANVKANFPSSTSDNDGSISCPSKVKISMTRLDWEAFASSDVIQSSMLAQAFDLVLGADIIYEPLHAEWIRECLYKLLRRPTEHIAPRFHLMIPLRPTFAAESGTMENVFPLAKGNSDGTGQELELAIFSKEIIICDVVATSTETKAFQESPEDMDDGEIVRYAYYIIGWGTHR
ncbi:hypothetical protein PM082_001132 [Marasmius tenuissimus]|nr:hypothetical protein PM082_001132 [Marasmius tenuissimus]